MTWSTEYLTKEGKEIWLNQAKDVVLAQLFADGLLKISTEEDLSDLAMTYKVSIFKPSTISKAFRKIFKDKADEDLICVTKLPTRYFKEEN